MIFLEICFVFTCLCPFFGSVTDNTARIYNKLELKCFQLAFSISTYSSLQDTYSNLFVFVPSSSFFLVTTTCQHLETLGLLPPSTLLFCAPSLYSQYINAYSLSRLFYSYIILPPRNYRPPKIKALFRGHKKCTFLWPQKSALFSWPQKSALFSWSQKSALFSWPQKSALFFWPQKVHFFVPGCKGNTA